MTTTILPSALLWKTSAPSSDPIARHTCIRLSGRLWTSTPAMWTSPVSAASGVFALLWRALIREGRP